MTVNNGRRERERGVCGGGRVGGGWQTSGLSRWEACGKDRERGVGGANGKTKQELQQDLGN